MFNWNQGSSQGILQGIMLSPGSGSHLAQSWYRICITRPRGINPKSSAYKCIGRLRGSFTAWWVRPLRAFSEPIFFVFSLSAHYRDRGHQGADGEPTWTDTRLKIGSGLRRLRSPGLLVVGLIVGYKTQPVIGLCLKRLASRLGMPTGPVHSGKFPTFLRGYWQSLARP